MEIPLPELIDRMSILKLKIESFNNPEVKKEYEAYDEAVKEFEDKGIQIKQEWFDELYLYNKEFWDNVIALKEAEEKNLGLAEMGKIYIRQRIANKKRVAVKNKITAETGIGFKDIKVN